MKIRKAVIIVVFMLLSISPWLYRNYRIYNSPTWISSNSGYMFWLGNRGDVIKDGFRHPINESTEIPNEAINAGNFNELEVQKRLFTITVRGMKTKDLLPLVWNKFMFMWILPVRTSTIATFIRNIYVLVESGYYYLILILGLFGLYKASNINNHHIVLFRKFILFLFICILINGLIFLPRARYRFPFEFIFIIPAGFGMFSILNSNRTMQNILNKL